MRRRAFLLLPALVIVVACGGGGGGGSSPTQPTPTPTPTPPPPGITFTAQSGGGGSNSISLASGSGTDLNNLVLEVRANSVQDLYGVAFDLRYPNTVLRYESSTAGFLNEGAQTSLNLVETSPGTLVVGYTRLGTAPGASGSGVLLTLRFSAVAAGSGDFTFAQNMAFNPRGESNAVTWSAGSVQVVR